MNGKRISAIDSQWRVKPRPHNSLLISNIPSATHRLDQQDGRSEPLVKDLNSPKLVALQGAFRVDDLEIADQPLPVLKFRQPQILARGGDGLLLGAGLLGPQMQVRQ